MQGLGDLFWSVSNYFDVATTPDAAERAALASAQLASASQHLQQLARLELWNTSFCHKISSFGNFERYDRDEFRALLFERALPDVGFVAAAGSAKGPADPVARAILRALRQEPQSRDALAARLGRPPNRPGVGRRLRSS